MRRYAVTTAVLVLGVMLAVQPGPRAIAAADEPSLLQIDNDFVQAAAKHDKATVGRLLDTDFTWTEADGKTQARIDVLKSLPTPALGNETGAQLKPRTYGLRRGDVCSRQSPRSAHLGEASGRLAFNRLS